VEHGDGIGVRVEHRHYCATHNVPPHVETLRSRRPVPFNPFEVGVRTPAAPGDSTATVRLSAIGASSSVGVP
jgi:hypothetical protein